MDGDKMNKRIVFGGQRPDGSPDVDLRDFFFNKFKINTNHLHLVGQSYGNKSDIHPPSWIDPPYLADM
jgi:hypothetical protein